MKSFIFPVLYVVIQCSIMVIEVYSKNAEYLENALIYNRETKQLDEIREDDGDKKCRFCVTACPAATEYEILVNNRISIAKNSVFLQKVYNLHEYAKNIELNICAESFKPSVVIDKIKNTYETGYEFYYGEGKIKLECPKYHDFKSIIKKNIEETDQTNSVNIPFVKIVGENNTSFYFVLHEGHEGHEGETMVFYWIAVLSFKFNVGHQIRVNFQKDSINDYQTMDKCENYDLGKELYQAESDFDFFYSEPNQKNMFTQVHMPPPRSPPKKDTLSCGQAYGCLGKAQIIPMMYFHTRAAKLATCTKMNVIPVWDSIINGNLKFIDQYLYAIFRLWYPHINIIFGVSEVVKFQTTYSKSKPSEIYLTDEYNRQRIPIPKIMYRIVEYHALYKTYYVVIVIHNDPTSIADEDRICGKNFEVASWEMIRNEDPATGFSYACVLLPRIAKQLGAYDKMPPTPYGTLHLMPFPAFKLSAQKLEMTDVREQINDKVRSLFGEDVIPRET